MSLKKKHLIVIGGATASGKTALAIQLAQFFKTEILSADSRQFYKEMTIGTAKPNEIELQQVTHHFINHLSISDNYSIGAFEKEARSMLKYLFEKHDAVILVGGSGLYIKALCDGIDTFPEISENVRQQLENDFEVHGISFLQQELQHLDPVYYAEADIQNPQRLMRALSVCRASGQPYSSFRSQSQKERFFTPIYILLQVERSILYDRINRRVDAMMQAGLLDEVKSLAPYKHLNALQTVGYTEIFDYLEEKHSLGKAIELIKQHSRNYAKRQVTWFKKDMRWHIFSPEQVQEIINYICRQKSEIIL